MPRPRVVEKPLRSGRLDPMLPVTSPFAFSIVRPVDEPGAVVPPAGICEGPPGNGQSYLNGKSMLRVLALLPGVILVAVLFVRFVTYEEPMKGKWPTAVLLLSFAAAVIAIASARKKKEGNALIAWHYS